MARIPRTRRPYPQVIALDLSLNSTGWAYRTADGRVESGTITPGRKRGSSRLWHNRTQLRSIVRGSGAAVAVVEGYAMNGKGKTFHIGEWGGVARLLLWGEGFDVTTITPSTLKMVVCGSGSPGKTKLHQAVKELLHTNVTQEDELDAMALLLLYEAMQGLGSKEVIGRLAKVRASNKPGIEVEEGSRMPVCN